MRKLIETIVEQKGYEVNKDISSVFKNGIEFPCVAIRLNSIQSINLYFEHLKEDEVEDYVDRVLSDYAPIPQNLIENFFDLEKVKDVIYPCIQSVELRKNEVGYKINDYFNVYYRIISNGFSIKISDRLLDVWKISVDDIKKIAFKNLEDVVSIVSMEDILYELTHSTEDEADDVNDFESPMTVVKNKLGVYGASAVLSQRVKNIFKECEYRERLVLIPSSIHEVIILNCEDNEMDLDYISEMVREVNGSEVLPEDILLDKAFLLSEIM